MGKQSKQRLLNDHYYNVSKPSSFGGIGGLQKATKVSKNQVKQWLERQDTYTLHRPVQYKFPRRRVIVPGMHHQWQADLVDVSAIKRFNQHHSFILTVIDVFSKVAWAVPLKNKSGPTLAKAFLKLLKKAAAPKVIQTDKGKEFLNKHVQHVFHINHIHHFTTHNQDIKAGIVERFNRTLKNKMWRYFTRHATLKFIDVLDDMLLSYNHTYHRSIKMAPCQVSPKNQEMVWQTLYGEPLHFPPPRFKVGDHVRISKVKQPFRKGYLPNWSEEIFIIHKVKLTQPVTYCLNDMMGEELDGSFYEQELGLVHVESDKVFRIEKVLREKKVGKQTQCLIKWLGYDHKFNSWVNKSDIEQYKDAN